MPEFTKRHLLVSRLVLLSLGMAGFFGVVSVLFALSQNRFSNELESKQSVSALDLSLSVDASYLAENFKISALECEPSNPQTCTDLIESMAMLKNRLEDYEILFIKTLGFSSKAKIVADLSEFSSRIDQSSKVLFGLSLKDAASLGLLAPKDMINHVVVQEHFKFKQADGFDVLVDLRANFANRIFDRLEQELAELKKRNNSPEEMFRSLRQLFVFVFAVEVLIFLLVNGIDIVNNNADPDQSFEFTFQKIQPKVRPLVISLVFAFLAMLSGQYLLYRESKLNFLDACKSLNRQNIGFFNTIESYVNPELFVSIHPKFQPPSYCYAMISGELEESLSALPVIADASASIKQELLGYKLRLYADAYQDSVSVISEETQWYLFSILVLNVSSLAVMSVFLKYDSEDIG